MDGRSTGNYEKQVYFARDLFLRYDQDAMIRKFDLTSDGQFLYVELLHQSYRISRSTGVVERLELDGMWTPCENYELVMTIYDVLCHSAAKPELSGEWGPLYGLQATMSSPSPDKIFVRYAEKFSGRTEALAQACLALGGACAEECRRLQQDSDIAVLSGHLSVLGGRRGVCAENYDSVGSEGAGFYAF